MARILIVEADYYPEISNKIVTDANGVFVEAGHEVEHIKVGGALEIPQAVAMAIDTERYQGFFAVGCVIRGETYHFEIVSNESARGLNELAMYHTLPISNCILTVENKQQALDRSHDKSKGVETAKTLIGLLQIKNNFVA